MAETLMFHYDPIGDILYIDKRSPYAEQESEEIGDEVIVRLNPVSGEVENLEVLFFTKRLTSNPFLELPIIADLKIATA
jgi:uncharacterized protein YuzE